ncbi:flagellar hook-length control protein FliK [Ruegeria arenilitoris]|uniref:flagellar hook-length control protein FliK n=1 Tax=Ruegeria arenilitoris TaxID=1173585 RepID=UPI00147E5EE4|nr:flagellar hook-length control protein FliK [Ruegeria arenilitoris]
MPNPLSAVMSSHTAAAKPDATPPKARESNSGKSFQTVMDQDTSPQSSDAETTDLLVQDPEAAAELEVAPEEVESADSAVAPDDQPLAEIRPVTAEAMPKPDLESTPREQSATPAVVLADAESTGDKQPDLLQADLPQTAESPAQRLVPPVFQALVSGSDQPRRPTEHVHKPQSLPMGPVVVDQRPKELPSLSVFTGPDRDTPLATPLASPAPKHPKTPDRAPTFVQMQLLATEKTSLQAETQPVPEIEDIQTARETTTLSAARDSGPAMQAMTATARAETARAIASQMATAINVRSHSGTIEVALNPEELGRVSIVLNGRDDGLHLTISAERPETLDMMRRHLSVLEAEFQNFGLGDLSFDLGTSADAQHDDSDGGEGNEFSTPQPEHVAETGPARPKIAPDGRIDMRL